jgi:hypothetical protein
MKTWRAPELVFSRISRPTRPGPPPPLLVVGTLLILRLTSTSRPTDWNTKRKPSSVVLLPHAVPPRMPNPSAVRFSVVVTVWLPARLQLISRVFHTALSVPELKLSLWGQTVGMVVGVNVGVGVEMGVE